MHTPHAVDPAAADEPAAQPEHTVVPVAAEYLPATQLEQVALALAAVNFPTRQLAQLVAPDWDDSPAAHAAQLDEPLIGW